MKIDMPGLGGSLGECVICGKPFLKEILCGENIALLTLASVNAGQTVAHTHIHLIPRYRFDVFDPTGGVRGVIPARRRYDDQKK
jgi:diadenosine tetraphosphate (Ap4A) HIT family hydrolase